MSKLNLDLSGSQLMGSKVVLPTGNYSFEVVGAEAKQTAKGGWMVVVDSKVLAGEKAGVIVKQYINVVNPNEDTMRMGKSELKTIMTMGGHKNPAYLGDSSELIGLKFNAYVIEKPSTFTNKEGKTIETSENDFKAYSELSVVAEQISTTQHGLKEMPSAPPADTGFPGGDTQAAAIQGYTQLAPPAATSNNFPWAK